MDELADHQVLPPRIKKIEVGARAPSRMTIVLHIGVHKTGTTTVQEFAHQHRLQLQRRGCWYPDFGLIGVQSHYAHHDLAHALAGSKNQRLTRESALKFTKRVVEEEKSYDVVLISAEAFYRHTSPRSAKDGEEYWLARKRYISEVADAFAGADLRVIACIRRQDHLAQSLYNENVKSKRYRSGFKQFLVERENVFQYNKQLDLWNDFCGPTRAIVFEDLLANKGNLEHLFFDELGFDTRDLAPVPAQNESLPLEVISYLLKMNQTRLNQAQLRALGIILASGDFADKVKAGLERRTWMGEDEFVRFQSQFEASNAAVRRKYTTLSRDHLFPNLEAPVGLPMNDLDQATFFQLTAALLNSLNG